MNDNSKDDLEFDVLGFKVRFRPDLNNKQCSAYEVVKHVRQEAEIIRNEIPSLDRSQLAILLALKLAEEKLNLNKEYRDNINKLHSSVCDALQILEDQPSVTI